jgi:hypothetical protein
MRPARSDERRDEDLPAPCRRTIIASLRWRIALVLSIAIAISYLDRQALSVAIAAIQREIPLTNTQFCSTSHALGRGSGPRASTLVRRTNSCKLPELCWQRGGSGSLRL